MNCCMLMILLSLRHLRRSCFYGMESKGLRVNMKKTKIMISGLNLGTLKDSGRFPFAVCRSGVGKNSIWCHGCSLWVHKKCTGIVGRSTDDSLSRCSSSFNWYKKWNQSRHKVDGMPIEVMTDKAKWGKWYRVQMDLLGSAPN